VIKNKNKCPTCLLKASSNYKSKEIQLSEIEIRHQRKNHIILLRILVPATQMLKCSYWISFKDKKND
jgi:hypothetical protein